ncbi:DUF4174 domain-containing protein [Christiangramia marina]|uniref:DUF4174 domain-containing protein n=1 Tax=Christiangramia marina TaxID=409436 RepID=UPI003AA8C6A0
MRNLTLLIIIIFYGMTSTAQDLQSYKWENRIIVVYSTKSELDLLTNQFDVLTKEPNKLSERKLLLIHASKDRYRTVFPGESAWINSSLNEDLRIAPDTGFEIFLIGLDGGIKLRQQEIVQTEKLFRLIDGMPMRRAEIRKQDQ